MAVGSAGETRPGATAADRVVDEAVRAILAGNRRRARWWNVAGRWGLRAAAVVRSGAVRALRHGADRLPRWTGVWRLTVMLAAVEMIGQAPPPPGLGALAFGPRADPLAAWLDAARQHLAPVTDGVRDPVLPLVADVLPTQQPWAPLAVYCGVLICCAAVVRRARPRRTATNSVVVACGAAGTAVVLAYTAHLLTAGIPALAAALRDLTLVQVAAVLVATAAIFLTVAGYKPVPRYRR